MCELMRVLAGCTWRGLTLYRIYSFFYADLFFTQKSNYEWSVFLSFHMFSTKLTLLISKGSLNAQGRGASSSWIMGHIVYHTIIRCVRSLIFREVARRLWYFLSKLEKKTLLIFRSFDWRGALDRHDTSGTESHLVEGWAETCQVLDAI